jgi:periplasmic divalent cation tolerance protein
MEPVHLIYVTTSNLSEAEHIAKSLVEERLVACANIIHNITSIYIWENKLTQDKEILLLLKTKESLVDRSITRIKELHSYTIPCIVTYEAKKGNPDYLDWIRNSE